MKSLVWIALLSLTFSCAKQEGKTSANFKFNLGAMTNGLGAAGEGGVVIYGKDDKDNAFSRLLGASTELNEVVPNGNWSFLAIAWEGPDHFEGKVRCAKSPLLKLDGNPVSVNLTLSNADCHQAPFAMNMNTVNGDKVFPKFKIETCNDLSKVINNTSACRYVTKDGAFLYANNNKGHAQSYKLVLNTFNKKGNFIEPLGEQVFSTQCAKVSNSSEGALDINSSFNFDDLNIPVGDGQFPFGFSLIAYVGNDQCDDSDLHGVVEVKLPFGSGTNLIQSKSFPALDGATHLAKLYVRVSDADVCSGIRMFEAEIGANEADKFAAGKGSINFPYVICTIGQLHQLTALPISSPLYAGVYKLGKNLNYFEKFPLEMPEPFKMIGQDIIDEDGFGDSDHTQPNSTPFTGAFDGNNKKIIGISFDVYDPNMNGVSELGFIRNLGSTGILRNVTFIAPEMWGPWDAPFMQAGFAVGASAGEIHFVHVKEGKAEFNEMSGGLVGRLDADGFIADSSFHSKKLSGKRYIGGLAGVIDYAGTKTNKIIRSKSTGNLELDMWDTGCLENAGASDPLKCMGNLHFEPGFLCVDPMISNAGTCDSAYGAGSWDGILNVCISNDVDFASCSGNSRISFNNNNCFQIGATNSGECIGAFAGGLCHLTDRNDSFKCSGYFDYKYTGQCFQTNVSENTCVNGMAKPWLAPQYGGGLVGKMVSCPAGANAEIIASTSSMTVNGDSVIGGLVGYLGTNCKIDKSYSTSNVIAKNESADGKRSGGLVGKVGSTTQINQSFHTMGFRSSGTLAGGILGAGSSSCTGSFFTASTSTGSGCTTQKSPADSVDATTYSGLSYTMGTTLAAPWFVAGADIGFDFPRFYWEVPRACEGKYNSSFVDAQGFTYICNKAQFLNMNSNAATKFRLMNDINFIGDSTAVNYKFDIFNKELDGNHRSLNNLVLQNNSATNIHTGLFGVLNSAAKVYNLNFYGADVYNQINLANYGVGIVAGSNLGRIEKVSVQGSVQGQSNIGGIVGINQGAILACESSAEVMGSLQNVGGVAGHNNGIIIYNEVFSMISTVANSDVTSIGGIVGLNTMSTPNLVVATPYGTLNDRGLVRENTFEGKFFISTGSEASDKIGSIVGYNNNAKVVMNAGILDLFDNSVAGNTSTILYVGGLIGYLEGSNPLVQNNFSRIRNINGSNMITNIFDDDWGHLIGSYHVTSSTYVTNIDDEGNYYKGNSMLPEIAAWNTIGIGNEIDEMYNLADIENYPIWQTSEIVTQDSMMDQGKIWETGSDGPRLINSRHYGQTNMESYVNWLNSL